MRHADADEARSGPRKRIIFAIVAVAVIIVAIVWGVPWMNYMFSHEGTDDAHVAADEVAVTSKIPERIDQILVDTNQPVHRGQLLMVLDNKDELGETARGAGAIRSCTAPINAARPNKAKAASPKPAARLRRSKRRCPSRKMSSHKRPHSIMRRKRKFPQRSKPTIKRKPISPRRNRWSARAMSLRSNSMRRARSLPAQPHNCAPRKIR